MESKQIKCLAVVILCMVAVTLCCQVFWPANLSLPYQFIIPSNAYHRLFMFFISTIIILAVTCIPQLFRNSNGVTADDIFYEYFGKLAYCQQHIVSCHETTEQETPDSEYGQPTEQMKCICSAENAGANARYNPSKLEKVGCMDIVQYTEICEVENCSVSLPELMQLVEVPEVIDSKKYNELVSMIDEDFNRTVEEFIAEFKGQLRLQRQLSLSRRRLQP